MGKFSVMRDEKAHALAKFLYMRMADPKWIWVWRKMSEPRYPNGMASEWSERNFARRRLERVKRGRKGRWGGVDRKYNMAVNLGSW